MCSIRIIRRTLSSEINDKTIELSGININPIDKPAYVIYVGNEEGHGIEFIFTSDKEGRIKYQNKGIVMEYGVNSGRIYEFYINKRGINLTDTFHIINHAITDSATERFEDNIKKFIATCNQIIEFSIKNPV